MIAAGLIDAAVVGGVDTLCLTTLYGFHSLQLMARTPCRPFDRHRDGLSIARRRPCVARARIRIEDDDAVLLLGTGESSDACHMSSPHPEGAGRPGHAARLGGCRRGARRYRYLNLHGTAHRQRQRRILAVTTLFGTGPPAARPRPRPGARSVPRRARGRDLRAPRLGVTGSRPRASIATSPIRSSGVNYPQPINAHRSGRC